MRHRHYEKATLFDPRDDMYFGIWHHADYFNGGQGKFTVRVFARFLGVFETLEAAVTAHVIDTLQQDNEGKPRK